MQGNGCAARRDVLVKVGDTEAMVILAVVGAEDVGVWGLVAGRAREMVYGAVVGFCKSQGGKS